VCPIGPDRCAKAIAAAERQWQEFNLLHFNQGKSG
jgi:hypothetical protein